ncbi:endonuclease III [Spirochaetia bacterium]|nr:endonuclease III [Spirochaetia bacterium]
MKTVNWDDIMSSLDAWRDSFPHDTNGEPSVTTVAERYAHDPWSVLVSTIISLRTKDDVTLRSSNNLLERAPTPEFYLTLSQEEAEKLIFPAGFYRTKACNLRKIAGILVNKYDGDVPADFDALLSMPGVGRKTANLVMIEAFDLDGICVDTHVHRISNRAGWLAAKTPEDTEMKLRKILPRKYWKRINALLVLYGQRLCRPISPYCSICVISKNCEKINVTKTR